MLDAPGSGKTFTMMGKEEQSVGIYIQAARDIYERLEPHQKIVVCNSARPRTVQLLHWEPASQDLSELGQQHPPNPPTSTSPTKLHLVSPPPHPRTHVS